MNKRKYGETTEAVGTKHQYKCFCGATVIQEVIWTYDKRWGDFYEWSTGVHPEGSCLEYRLKNMEQKIHDLEQDVFSLKADKENK